MDHNDPNLASLATELHALESETFEIRDYFEANDLLVVPCSTCSSTTSTTSCCA